VLAALAQARKFIAALTVGVGTAVAAGLLSGTAQRWTVGGLAIVASSLAVFLVPNSPPPDVVVIRPAPAPATTSGIAARLDDLAALERSKRPPPP
jgi:hypothetical protein